MTLDMKEYCTEEYQTRISAWREKVPASRPEATAARGRPQSRPPRRGRPRRRDLREGAVYVRARAVHACAYVRVRACG